MLLILIKFIMLTLGTITCFSQTISFSRRCCNFIWKVGHQSFHTYDIDGRVTFSSLSDQVLNSFGVPVSGILHGNSHLGMSLMFHGISTCISVLSTCCFITAFASPAVGLPKHFHI